MILEVGGKKENYRTINEAAAIAMPGDTVLVHEGIYRECVVPQHGGSSEKCRITYMAVPGERVTILGSEPVCDWQPAEGTVYFCRIDNKLFGDWNPFAVPVMGDWVVDPYREPVHLGEVYLNGKSCFEAPSYEKVLNPEICEFSPHETWGNRKEPIYEPERMKHRYYAEVKENETLLYVNFGELVPQETETEINVRKSCFFPEKTNLDYITVRGFAMGRAATPWAPPTGDQPGLIGPHWSRGWIIEDNEFFEAKCSAVSLGKEISTGDCEFTRFHKKPGYQYQVETVFKGLAAGWNKETIGGHIVRRNKIHDCGQNGIVGNLGCAFSLIEDNEISHISDKHEFYGHELGGIKFHGAIDTIIRNNHIHHCSLGTWLDWEAQGIRLSGNIYEQNARDLMIEVTHGPAMVDHNIFADEFALVNAAQGTAFVHNLFLGFIQSYDVRDRSTPYHLPHSTQVAGYSFVYGGDDRFYNNIFVGGELPKEGLWGQITRGTDRYNGAPTSLEEYTKLIADRAPDDDPAFAVTQQPAYIDGNMYLGGAAHFDREKHFYASEKFPQIVRTVLGGHVRYEIVLPPEVEGFRVGVIGTHKLGVTRCAEEGYETPEGEPYWLDVDLYGMERDALTVPGPLC